MFRHGRILLTAVVLSAAFTAALWLSASANGAGSGASSSYAVLTVARDTSDREIVDALKKAGIDNIVSESTQWVLINDFGEWEKIPLDSFNDRIESFDPRNDGYAERVRPLFVSDRDRTLYLKRPLSILGAAVDSTFSRSVSHAMGTRKYELKLGGSGRVSIFPFLLTILAAAAVVLLSKSFAPAAFLPAMLAFAGFGSSGLVASTFLCAASLLFTRAFSELLRGRTHIDTGLRKLSPPWIFDSMLPGFLCLGGLPIISFLCGLPLPVIPFAAFSAISVSFTVALTSVLIDHRRRHARFSPIGLRPDFRSEFASLSTFMLPFALAAGVFSVVELSGIRFSGGTADVLSSTRKPTVSLEDFSKHIESQRAFLTSRVMDAGEKKGYTIFTVGADGFAVVSDQSVKNMPPPPSELPPAERFLADVGVVRARSGRDLATVNAFSIFLRTFSVIAVAFVVSFPALRAYGSKRRQLRASSSVADKRIAA